MSETGNGPISRNDRLRDIYLDYVNNYLTVECMAEHYNVSVELTEWRIRKGREIHRSNLGET